MKKALFIFLLLLSGCGGSLETSTNPGETPNEVNIQRYKEAIAKGRVPLIIPPQPQAEALVVAPVKPEADVPSAPPQVVVKMKPVKMSQVVCPHCNHTFQIVEE